MPMPPDVITSLDIATHLSTDGQRPSRAFVKAIQRVLRELRIAELARSVPFGEGSQLAWHLPRTESATADEQVLGDALQPPLNAHREPRVLSVTPKPFIVERRKKRVHRPRALTSPPHRVAVKAKPQDLRDRVLSLVPYAPDARSASAIAVSLHNAGQEVSVDAVKIVQAELRALQMRQLARAVRLEGGAELGWQRPSAATER